MVTGVTDGTNGTVTTDGTTVTYTPNADFNGTDSFTYTVTSGGVTETATVTVTVNAVADIADDTLTTNEDTPVTINVLANDGFEGRRGHRRHPGHQRHGHHRRHQSPIPRTPTSTERIRLPTPSPAAA